MSSEVISVAKVELVANFPFETGNVSIGKDEEWEKEHFVAVFRFAMIENA